MIKQLSQNPVLKIVNISSAYAQKLRDKIAPSEVGRLAEKWQDVVKAIIRPDSEKEFQDFQVFYQDIDFYEQQRELCTKPTGYADFYQWVYGALKTELKARSKETGKFKLRDGDDPVLFGMAGRTMEKRDNVLVCHVSRQQRVELKDITAIPENWKETVSAVLNGQAWILTRNNSAKQLLNIKHHSEPNIPGYEFYNWVVELLKTNNEVKEK